MRLQVSKTCRHLKVPLEFENHHQALSGNCWQASVPHWLSSRDFSSLPWGTSTLLTGWRLSPESEITERKRDSKTEGLVLYNLIPETDTPSHLLYVLGHTEEPWQHVGRGHTKVWGQGVGASGAISEAGCPTRAPSMVKSTAGRIYTAGPWAGVPAQHRLALL